LSPAISVGVDPYPGVLLLHDLGNGIDEGALRRAGIEDADVFVALTQGDNRNITATQIAKHVFNVPRTICRVYDPLRQELYNTLGIETLSPTTIFAQLMKDKIENPEEN